MITHCVLGVDIGTSSSKGVLVGVGGRMLAQAAVSHDVSRPRQGQVEMDGELWWQEFLELTGMLLSSAAELGPEIRAVGVSGMGPCLLVVDEVGVPIRPAILYGVDTRSESQCAEMTDELGEVEIVRIGGSRLTTQAIGPKLLWLAQNERTEFERARKLFMPASWLVHRLTGAYVLDHHSASQCSPLYDINAEEWHDKWWARYGGEIEQPLLKWGGEVAGEVNAEAAKIAGIAVGTPVIAGTIDAWSEAVSIDALNVGDLMLMYGTTMFLIATTDTTLRSPSMWTTAGVAPHSRNIAGGLGASGALTAWVKELTQGEYPDLLAEADASGTGARGLLALPYFAGERTPILDPNARGAILGLTLSHGRGDIYRAMLEATAFGVRHNIEAMREAGTDIRRIVAAGGGLQGLLWPQIVSDVTGLTQELPRHTIGASYGSAFLAAAAIAEPGFEPHIAEWNPIESRVIPDERKRSHYDHLFALYKELYKSTANISHSLAKGQTSG